MHAHINDEDAEEILAQEIIMKDEVPELKLEDWRVCDTQVCLYAVKGYVILW